MPPKTTAKKPKSAGISKARPNKSRDVTNLKRLANQLLDESTILDEIPNGASKKPSRSSKTDKTSQGQQKAAILKQSDPRALVDIPASQVALDTLVALVDTVRIIQQCVGLNLSLSGSNDDLLNKLEDQLADID